MYRENILVRKAADVLAERLPRGWSAVASPGRPSHGDATILVSAPVGRQALVAVEVRQRMDPRRAREVRAQLGAGGVAVAPWLSPATREVLVSEGLGFIDLTGNIRLVLDDPGLFVEALGAERDPDPEQRQGSLKGAKAARLVRELCASPLPRGVRELAAAAATTPGYASKLLAMLDKEAIIGRTPEGKVERVELARLLERWASDAPLSARAVTTSWLDPRGIAALLARLPDASVRYAVTGSLAAARKAPVAAARAAALYVDDPDVAATELGLRPADAGANVLLLAPTDDVVFDDLWVDGGVRYAALSQVAADLLSGPGRGPAEAEALIAWMVANREVWVG